jgi:hypothetical protein
LLRVGHEGLAVVGQIVAVADLAAPLAVANLVPQGLTGALPRRRGWPR